jgi:hypothetical protein
MLMILLPILIRLYKNLMNVLVRFLLLSVAVVLMLPATTQAQTELLTAKSAKFTGERPNADGPPTDVHLGLFLIDVDLVEDATQRFNADLFLNVSWQDPRLALPKRQRKGLIRTVPLSDIWWPRGFILNERGVARKLQSTAEVDDDGNVRHQQRVIGLLAVDLDFKDFPFDRQILPIVLVTYANSTEDVRFLYDPETTGGSEKFSVEGWRLSLLEPVIAEFDMPGDARARPKITFMVAAERVTRYYLLTLVFPMAMIILMAWSVFWLQPDIIPPRISIATASIFSFVAFGFSIRARLPEVSYLTRADQFVTGCTFLVFLALAVTVAGSRLANSDRMDKALRLNAISRWLYILLFVGVVYLSFFY